MSARVLVARRLGLMLLSIWLVFTLAFLFVALTPDPNVNVSEFSAAQTCTGSTEERNECIEEKVEAYRQANDLGEPVTVRYARWLVAMVTLDWGVSTSNGAPVLGSILSRLPYTLAYVVPAILLSAAGGLSTGTYAALHSHERADTLGRTATYLGYGVPNFWLAAFLLWFVRQPVVVGGFIVSVDPYVEFGDPLLDPGTLAKLVLPILVLSTTLFASQLRHARGETLELAGTEFVKLARAKGFGDRGVGRHILRLTAPLLVSLLVVDLFGVVVVNVFVIEFVFELPGFGDLTYEAIKRRDLPMVLGSTMVFAFVGIVGNTLGDFAALAVDPRTGDGER